MLSVVLVCWLSLVRESVRCPTRLRDLDPQNTDLVGFAQESRSSDPSPWSGNIMDDQQQRRFRAAYLYYAR